MAADAKAQPPMPKLKRRSARSCGFWFTFGLMLGGFAVGLYLMVRTPIQAPPTGPAMAKVEPAKSAPVTQTRFDFHDILPELEVVVSDSELKSDLRRPEEKKSEEPKRPDTAKPETLKPPAASEPMKSAYMVQVASLKTAADAERVKAQLAMQGIQAKVQTVTINGKDTYHRVQAGPYQGTQAVNEVRNQLKAKGMDTIAIKLK
jgi:cell division protein FtsN